MRVLIIGGVAAGTKTGYMALPRDNILSKGNPLHPLEGKSLYPPLHLTKVVFVSQFITNK